MTPLDGRMGGVGAVRLRRGSLLVTKLRTHRAAYFWPGLPQLWMRGSWAGLLVAVGFTALLNVLLWATLVFGEWLPLETQLIGYAVLSVIWLLARWQTRAERRANLAANDELDQSDGSTEGVPSERDGLFREAQGHYLRNDWVATEQLLLKLLKQESRDVESRLMLATLWRHQGRLAEAQRQLDRVARLEAAEPWKHEIAAERMALEIDENEQHQTEPVNDAPVERSEEESNASDDELRRAA